MHTPLPITLRLVIYYLHPDPSLLPLDLALVVVSLGPSSPPRIRLSLENPRTLQRPENEDLILVPGLRSPMRHRRLTFTRSIPTSLPSSSPRSLALHPTPTMRQTVQYVRTFLASSQHLD